MEISYIWQKGKFDLHLHTTSSDGVYSPSEVVEKAAQKGVTVIAITDHDTLDGISEAIEAGRKLGIEVIPGIELSTKYKGKTIDILGFNIQESEELSEVLKKMREYRQNRSQLIIKKLGEINIIITEDDVQKNSKGGVIARPHVAQAVVDKGYAKDMQEVFDLYLGDGKPCAIDKMVLSPEEGIKLIHNAGGSAVLAHPLLIGDDIMVEELMKLPFDGIEIWHRKHQPYDIIRYKGIAEKYKKFMTGGSDFHHDEHHIGEFGFRFN